MFTHVGTSKPIDLIERVSVSGVRYYGTPEGKQYPSITSILATQDKPQIKAWIERVGKEESDRIRIASATRGTILHSTIEDYLNNEDEYLVPPFDSITEEMSSLNTNLFNGIQPQLNKINNIHGQELPLWSDVLKYAGTADIIAEYEGALSLIDIKTSLKPKPTFFLDDYWMQTSAYSQMYMEQTGTMVKQSVILMANEESPNEPQVFIKSWDDCKPFLKRLVNIYKESNLYE